MTIPAPVLMTAEELLAKAIPNKRTELVRGRLIVREKAGWRHGDVAARVLVAISTHLSAERCEQGMAEPRGRVVAAETGFTLQRNPDPVRRVARVYRADGSEAILGANGILSGEDVLPEMTIALAELFD